MYNLFRKSIILLTAGLSLLFLFSCETTAAFQDITAEKEPLTIETLFSPERNTLIYLNSGDNRDLLNSLSDRVKLDSFTKKTLLNSQEIFLAANRDIGEGFDLLLKGDLSRSKMEFGLFLSFSWRKLNDNGYRYWISKDGVKLYFVDDNTILVTTFDMVDLIDRNVGFHSYIAPDNSLLLLMPRLAKEDVETLTMGFIKGGLDSFNLSMNKSDNLYNLTMRVGVLDGKAKAFSHLIKLFAKSILSKSKDPQVKQIGSKMVIDVEDNSVVLDDVVLKEGKIVELLNNLLVINREADK